MGSSILVLGAGRSSSSLISYLESWAVKSGGAVTVGDLSLPAAQALLKRKENAIVFDISDTDKSRSRIRSADIIISMLPALLHPRVADLCLQEKKHLLTASYVSEYMSGLHEQAKQNGLLFLNECGLDPGIDHMSAMQLIHKIMDEGGLLYSFESFTGGLIAPETDPANPWRYKFTWNPRNVVLAGQGVSKFLEGGMFKYIPYQQLFRTITEVDIPGHGRYEGYANRDSLKYIVTYGIPQIKTMLRGTLRFDGYSAAWDTFVQLGCTDDTYEMEGLTGMTHRDFIDSFLETDSKNTVEEKLMKRFRWSPSSPELVKLKWSGFFDNVVIGLSRGTPARVLEHILNKRWKLDPTDKDLVVMWHRLKYQTGDKKHEVQSYLVVKGEDHIQTAMAKTVGLPLAIAAKLLAEGKISERGVVIPVSKDIYEPILKELAEGEITFEESRTSNT